MKRGAFMSAWLGLVGFAGAQTTSPDAPPAEPVPADPPKASAAAPAPPRQSGLPTGRIWHLKLSGDLDCDRLARDFAAQLERAASDRGGAALVVVELDGNRARPDLVLATGRRLAECRVRTAAYLADSRDHRVGLGQALLGALCTDAFIAPGTRIIHTPADDLRSLAPDDTDWERIAEQLAAETGPRIESRAGDPALASLLLDARSSAWFVASSEGERIETAAQQGGAGTQFIFFGASGLERLDIDAPLAASLRLVRAGSPGVARMLNDLGARGGASRSRAECSSGLTEAERRLVRSMDDLLVALEQIEESLRVTNAKLDRRPLAIDYRKAGEAALVRIAAAERNLSGAEALAAEYPELMREESTTPSASRPRVLANLRRDLSRHRAAAEEYRTRR